MTRNINEYKKKINDKGNKLKRRSEIKQILTKISSSVETALASKDDKEKRAPKFFYV